MIKRFIVTTKEGNVIVMANHYGLAGDGNLLFYDDKSLLVADFDVAVWRHVSCITYNPN